MNVFTGDHYYSNVIIYSFVTFFGSIAFYRTITEIYSCGKTVALISSFLIPSFLFWTSGMYKDGFIFLFMSLAVFQTNLWMTEKKSGLRRLFIIMLCLASIFLLRTYVALLLAPALAGWLLSSRSGKKGTLIFPLLYLFLISTVLILRFIDPSLDILKIMASWQNAFLKLPANSAIHAETLEPTINGFLRNLPQALNFGFLRPYLWEQKGWQYFPYALEIAACYFLILIFILRKQAATNQQIAFRLFCFFLVTSAWLFIGYTVHIIGAITRYKSIFLPFLIAPLICSVNWKSLIYIKKINL